MKVLLDHNVPHRLRLDLAPLDVSTTHYMGWNNLDNGDLMAAAAQADFRVLITADRGVGFQQGLAAYSIGLVFLHIHPFTYPAIRPFAAAITEAAGYAAKGQQLSVFRA
ncbi:MAG: hypothetical protein AAGJ10_00685 [Bacteroidota bacterium]